MVQPQKYIIEKKKLKTVLKRMCKNIYIFFYMMVTPLDILVSVVIVN